jgi:hypothetical protein
MVFLQRAVGNQAVIRLFKAGVIQAKLRIGQSNDIFEQEADRVAEQVMRVPEPLMEGKLDNAEASSDIESHVNSIRGGGQPLPESVRRFFEPRFGQDFTQVRIHTDTKSTESAKGVNALAYTVGRDVVFGFGQYAPNTVEGKKLLAHELTHVVQHSSRLQRQGMSTPPIPASTRANRIFSWMEGPLKTAVKDPSKIDGWSDNAVAALVLVYNKMRNENVWQYVREIKHTSPEVSVDFFPNVSHASLSTKLSSHAFVDCLSSWGLDWGVRKERACGPHLHFKHFKPHDNWVNVHIDKIDPCCGYIPIIGRVISGLRHYHSDVRLWSKRNPDKFLNLLQKQGVPLSTGIINYLNNKGYI